MKPDTSPGQGYGLPSLYLYGTQTLLNSGTASPRLHTDNKRHLQTNEYKVRKRNKPKIEQKQRNINTAWMQGKEENKREGWGEKGPSQKQ